MKLTVGPFLLVIASLLTFPAEAGQAPLDDGVARFRKGQYVAATTALQRALEDRSLTKEELASARAYLSASLFFSKREAAARDELKRLYAEAPAVSLDEGEFPPRFIAFAQAERPTAVIPSVVLDQKHEPKKPSAEPAPASPDVAAKQVDPSTAVRLASFGLSFADVSQGKAEFFTETFNQALIREGVRVTGRQDVAALLGLERQKQLLGCDETAASCLAELGNALGVDGVITGNIAKLDGEYVIDLKVTSASSTRPLSLLTVQAASEGQLRQKLLEGAHTVAGELRRALGRSEPAGVKSLPRTELTSTGTSGLREKAWIPAVAGGALLAGGVVTSVLARGKAGAALSEQDLGAFHQRVQEGRTLETASLLLGGVGAASLATALAFYALGDDGPTASAIFTPDRAVVGIAGRF